MQSPFKIFRKYQKEMMAALVVLAMFAFVLGDALQKLFGNRAERLAASGGDAVVTIGSENEKLTRGDINQLLYRRRIANEFIARAVLLARPPESFEEQFRIHESLAKMQQQREIAERRFQFSGLPEEQDVIVGLLMRKEAERMGAVVSDEQVNRYIENSTHNKLTKSQFRSIISQLQPPGSVDAPKLYSILRDELLAKVAQGQELPSVAESPENYWEYYRRLHESQQIEAVPVATADFVDPKSIPDEKELAALFEKGKKSYDYFDDNEVFQPGFKQPDKVRIQYLREKYADVEARVAKSNPVTDKDVVDYYETNKDRLYQERLPFIDDKTPPNVDVHQPLDPLLTPGKNAPKPSGPQFPAIPELPKTDGKAPPAAPKTDKPATPATPPAGTVEKKAEAPKTPAPTPAPAKAADAPAKTSEKAAPKTDPAKKQSRSTRRSRIMLAAYADDKNAKPAAPAKVDAKPPEKGVDKSVAKKEPAEAPKTPAAPPVPPAKPEAKPELKPDVPAKAKDPAKAKPDAKSDPGTSPPPERKYRPLTEALKKEIREQIAKDRVYLEMRTQAELAQTNFRKVGNTLARKFNLLKPKAEDLPAMIDLAKAELTELAKTSQMEYGDTPLLNSLEFGKLTGLGGAHEPGSSFLEQTPSVSQRLFRTEETLIPGLAEDQKTSDIYVYWKVEHISEKIPDLTDKEAREQVIKAWRLRQAEPLARKRAEELTGILKQSAKPATETLAKTSVTGDAKSPQLTVIDVPPFTWLSTPSAQSGMFPSRGRTVQFSEVPRIEKPGQDFMSTIYNLKTGDWGVAPAYDRSVFYVVKLVARKEPKKEEFLKAPLFARADEMMFLGQSPYEMLAQGDSNRLFQRYLKKLNDKYKVKWAEKKKAEEQGPSPADYSDSFPE